MFARVKNVDVDLQQIMCEVQDYTFQDCAPYTFCKGAADRTKETRQWKH
jgi:hypothetical protein